MADVKKDKESQQQDAVQTSNEQSNQATGKGRPTPKRKEAQAQRLRPLVPPDSKEARKRAKARIRERENQEYEAMQTGDLNHMPKAERLPWRVYIRDYVDARFNIGEFFIPVALIILIASLICSAVWPNPMVTLVLMVILYVYLFAIIIDIIVMWRKLKKLLIAKYGEQAVAKGMRSGSYAWSRAIQLRRWRLPKPKYKKRGHWPK